MSTCVPLLLLQVNLKSRLGNSSLHLAAELGLVNICRLLLSFGADSSLMNHLKDKPVDIATPTVVKIFHEEPIKGYGDVESQLLEAAKNGYTVLIKVWVCVCVCGMH